MATQPLPSTSLHIRQEASAQENFRFFDNRQKYLLFVNTCSEKRIIAERIALELDAIRPRPPALRLFDAGVGDGTVLSRVMRTLHHRFPHMPFYIVGKEISFEDVRLTLDKMPDRFFEHPSTVFVLTNMYYSEAPWLAPKGARAAVPPIWHEVVLKGASSREFEAQISALNPFLAESWTARVSEQGNPVYDRPVALVLYREDHRFLLDPVIPRPGRTQAEFDLVIASQPYRARASAAFKAGKVVVPLARALGPGGRLLAVHSAGGDPGMEVIHGVWPDDHPFVTTRHQILDAVRAELGAAASEFRLEPYDEARSVFRYAMETLPNEITGPLGTSTILAAWNAAVYVAQIEDERLTEVFKDGRYLDATGRVLRRHGGLWFRDESYVIARTSS